jgi:hypothetical protein
MSQRLQAMSYIDLKGLKKAAAFRGNIKLERRIQNEMEARVSRGEVTKEEILAAAYL